MSIKQQGGVFGRNPTFNDVTIEGELTFDGDIDINSDLKIDGDLEVTNQAGIGVAPGTDRLHVANGTFRLSGNSIETVIGYSSYAVFGTTTNHDLQVRTNNVETGRFKPGIGLAFPSGYGIDFSATAGAGSTSELLDDYEEGTFTPTFSATGLTVTYDSQFGGYTKIGNVVYFRIQLGTDAVSGGSGSEALKISGLPFSAGSVSASSGFGLVYGAATSFADAKWLINSGTSL